jgi:hypothetical protein
LQFYDLVPHIEDLKISYRDNKKRTSMSSVDHDTATVHAAKREKMTARTVNSRIEVLILKSVAFLTEFSKHTC